MKLEALPPKAAKLAGYEENDVLGLPYVSGFIRIGSRSVPLVSTELSGRDRLAGILVRWDLGRNNYRVLPGLYAVGKPGSGSPVLVTANYKLSFDSLRRELSGIDAWILVLDTKGVNVWCAAGKGSFGSPELVDKLSKLRMKEIVSHRKLILPQLGAPGVSAPETARLSGFTAAWGPVLASDLPAFLASGMKKTAAMRLVPFGLRERMAVAPVELAHAWPLFLAAFGLSFLLALPLGPASLGRFLASILPLAGSALVGTLAFPALLPWLPFRAFALKGAVLGLAWAAACALATGTGLALGLGLALVCGSVVSFIAMNFTGSSTYTSQPGANLEVEKGAIPMAASLAGGLALGAAARIFGI